MGEKLYVHQRQASWETQWDAVGYDLSDILFYHCKKCGISLQQEGISPPEPHSGGLSREDQYGNFSLLCREGTK